VSGGALAPQVRAMAWRSVVKTIRQPMLIVPPLIFPLFLLAVNVGGLDAATQIPGFPADSYLDFAIAVCFMQGAMFAMVNAGAALSRDVETGFLKRLALTPMQRAALLIGHLGGVMATAALCTAIYLLIGFAAGLEVTTGVGGVLVVIALAMVIALAFAGVGALIGLRSGSGEAVQGFFPLFFVALFLSSMSLPRPLIEQEWFRTIATWNPISYMVEGLRAPIITGWDGEALALGFGFALVIAVLTIFGAQAALKTRLVRT
jgi:ABC-2 type transport system permease protein